MTQGNRIRREPGDKDPVLARVGHELRTPLNSIIGFTGTLLMGMPGPLNEEQDRQLRTVQSSARRLLSLVNDLLQLLKIDGGERELSTEPTDCVAVLREVEDDARREAQQHDSRLNLDLPDAGVSIVTDRRALRQVLSSLAVAAIRLSDRAPIRIALRREGAQQGNAVAFRIEGGGLAIPLADRERFFEPFAHLDKAGPRSGSGLELHLCRKLAALIGGRIAIEGGANDARLVLELPG